MTFTFQQLHSKIIFKHNIVHQRLSIHLIPVKISVYLIMLNLDLQWLNLLLHFQCIIIIINHMVTVTDTPLRRQKTPCCTIWEGFTHRLICNCVSIHSHHHCYHTYWSFIQHGACFFVLDGLHLLWNFTVFKEWMNKHMNIYYLPKTITFLSLYWSHLDIYSSTCTHALDFKIIMIKVPFRTNKTS